MTISDKLDAIGNEAGRPRILVITLRRIGDVLLTTPLIRSLRRKWPGAQIDILVFRGTDGILAGNPDISNVLTLAENAPLGVALRLMRGLWRRYDLAISTQAGDRPTVMAWAAGQIRVGLTKPRDGWGFIKQRLLDARVGMDLSVHRIVESSRLLDAIGVALVPEVVCPGGVPQGTTAANGRYAVLHPNPKFSYKRWNAGGWRNLARGLSDRGLKVFATGGADAEERAYLDTLWPSGATSVSRLDGQLSWPQLAGLLRNASVYVGTDTSMTHLAAASGCPTVAIYGPVDPRIMGPWPVGGLNRPWDAAGQSQQRGNVWLVQNPQSCPFHILPCERMGCDDRLDGRAQCLDELTAERVLSTADAALTSPSPTTAPNSA